MRQGIIGPVRVLAKASGSCHVRATSNAEQCGSAQAQRNGMVLAPGPVAANILYGIDFPPPFMPSQLGLQASLQQYWFLTAAGQATASVAHFLRAEPSRTGRSDSAGLIVRQHALPRAFARFAVIHR